MLGRVFNTAHVDAYADWVLAEVKKQLPPKGAPGKKDVAQRANLLNQRIAQRTVEFAKVEKLNIYKKARLTARVREGMEAHGYPAPFIKSFSLDLLARVSRAESPSPAKSKKPTSV